MSAAWCERLQLMRRLEREARLLQLSGSLCSYWHERLANKTAGRRKARLWFMLHTHSDVFNLHIYTYSLTCMITQYRVSRVVEYTLRFGATLASDV